MKKKIITKEKSCIGKIKYENKKDAELTAFILNKKQNESNKLKCYFCQFCKYYHIGHVPFFLIDKNKRYRKRKKW